ncbi:prolyl-tRNA synthetase [Polychaeton citri CBS 116435]|uniref:proline--tRNA ligase n=1 Tax=Polychaeton citri CBS 116435 TaxID=1314669 RepID=A0A9P4QB75_9PEZI|nr:prolyl-tRNA synthetase [Polychaeton citri CBS 116435]
MSRNSHALKFAWRLLKVSRGRPIRTHYRAFASCNRLFEYDQRNYVSKLFAPTTGTKYKGTSGRVSDDNGTDLLLRAGFIRQAHSGVFHILPLGLRVQEKLERIIDRHMQGLLRASKASLSSITSEALWRDSGRFQSGRDSEFFQFEDRKGSKFLLSPTHEEEITSVVANAVASYEDLPLRIYQISRKYRDEARPRQGLLRGREFIMKDLYTFDASEAEALETYETARNAYNAIFAELGLPYLMASADSGNMGGNLSHEFHFVSDKGEDNVVSCTGCDYCVNEEVHAVDTGNATTASLPHQTAFGISKDGQSLLVYYFPADGQIERSSPTDVNTTTKETINPHIIRASLPDLSIDFGETAPVQRWAGAVKNSPKTTPRVINIHDPRIDTNSVPAASAISAVAEALQQITSVRDVDIPQITYTSPSPITSPQPGDSCPRCSTGHLRLNQAVEIGHTFHLGDRYSKPLKAQVRTSSNETVDVQMGCHGIGVSRVVGAVAAILADKRGLNWPLAIAPFGVVVVQNPQIECADDAKGVADAIVMDAGGLDCVIDDRQKSIPWKLNDADLIGYPFIVVFGRAWGEKKMLELQCRALGVREEVAVGALVGRLKECSELLKEHHWSTQA